MSVLLRRLLIIGIGFFECFIFSGLIFGWPALVYVLQEEKVYYHLCLDQTEDEISQQGAIKCGGKFVLPDGNLTLNFSEVDTSENDDFISSTIPPMVAASLGATKCNAQDKMFGLLYSIMLACFGIPSILIGMSLDSLGLRVTRIFGSAMTTGGFAFLSFASYEMPWTLWPGMLMICVGSNTMRLSGLQCANAWPERKSTILFLYTSAHAVSTTVFLMFQYANQAGIPLRYSAIALCIVCAMTFISSFILPKMKVEEVKEKAGPSLSLPQSPQQVQLLPLQNGNHEIDQEKQMAQKKEMVEMEAVPLMKSVLGMSFILHVFWMLNVYFLRFFTTSFNKWAWLTAEHLCDDPAAAKALVREYNTVAGVCSLISPFVSPLGGVITDLLLKKAAKKTEKVEKLASKFQASTVILITATTLLFFVYLCKIFLTPTAVYCAVIVVSLARPLVIGTVYTYTSIRFYPEHFNRLIGLAFTLVSALCLLHYPMFLWLFSDGFNVASAVTMAVIIFLTYSSPLHLLFRTLALKFAYEEVPHRKNI